MVVRSSEGNGKNFANCLRPTTSAIPGGSRAVGLGLDQSVQLGSDNHRDSYAGHKADDRAKRATAGNGLADRFSFYLARQPFLSLSGRHFG